MARPQDTIGWRFPPTNGGREDGFNDPGMAHFSGNPLVSLARETIQNSLDAGTGTAPVRVSFEIQEVERDEALGRDQLAVAVDACLREVDSSGDDEKAHKALTEAQRLLRRTKLPYLRVSDRNTTGLSGGQLRALIKSQGASVKNRQDAGGSHGIGKYAPFGVSPLRTVFYWTRFEQDGESVERFQGKAVLMSHQATGSVGEKTQGTGFYGRIERCQALRDLEVPERIRRVERRLERGNGTSLWIAGFQTDGWQKQIARSVAADFFHAIEHNSLSVTLEPDGELQRRDLVEINRSTIEEWFDYLVPEDLERDDDDTNDVAEAYQFWEMSRDGPPTAEKEDRDLGHCQLWIRVSDGLPRRVGIVRGTGMLITTKQQGLLQFRALRDFIAVCVFDTEKGNELLRKMENPLHNQFEPERLSDDGERRRGRTALRRITRWIREEIRKCAAPLPSEETTTLAELAQYLPDLEPDEPLDSLNSKDREQAFQGAAVVRLKPRRRIARSHQGSEVDDGDGVGTGNSGGGGRRTNTGDGGDGIGSGEGDGLSGSGARGGSRGTEAVPINDVRLVPVPGCDNRYLVGFTPCSSGVARIELEEAGDSTGIQRADVQAFTDDRTPLQLDQLELTAGQRILFEITGTAPIGGRAWRVHAVRVAEENR